MAALLGRLLVVVCLSSVLFLSPASPQHGDRRDVLDSTEFPAEPVDPAAIDLTPLVNTLINSSQSGSRQLFSVLSVTSYSSLALHKLTLLVYNISSIRSVERDVFRRRFCYCVTNDTNDLTDFTAVLLDVIGNSTSYLHELFKSASILSVSHRNNSECIYICVMAGKMGRRAVELWDQDSITPLFNQTIVEGPHAGNVSALRLEWLQVRNLSHVSGISSVLSSRIHSTAHVSPSSLDQSSSNTEVAGQPSTGGTRSGPSAETTRRATRPAATARLSTAGVTPLTSAWRAPPARPLPVRPTEGQDGGTATPSRPEETERAGCPRRRAESGVTVATLSAQKLQPCLLELCKFFSQCLCKRLQHGTRVTSFCVGGHVWYEKLASEVCGRVKRVSFSRSLKQRCLTTMCSKL